MKIMLSQIEIKTGLTLGKVKKAPENGNFFLIQTKDLLKEGSNRRLDTSELDRIYLEVSSKSKIWCVNEGDIIVQKKGGDWQAHLIESIPENTVIGQNFLLLRVEDKVSLSPEFLVFYLNLPSIQEELDVKSGGGKQASISKKDLDEIQIPCLSAKEQKDLVELATSIEAEKKILLALIANRERQLKQTIKLKLESLRESD
jgi:restriction endonuclease S subunit